VIRRARATDDAEEEDELEGDDLGVEQGVQWLLNKVDAAASKKRSRDDEVEPPADQISEALRNAGAVHTHLNSSVLGGAHISSFRRPGGAAEGGAPPPEGKRRVVDLPARVSIKSSSAPSLADAPTCAPCASPPFAEPTTVDDCLDGCQTFQQYFRRLHEEPELAWRAECFRKQRRGDELAEAVSALRDEVLSDL